MVRSGLLVSDCLHGRDHWTACFNLDEMLRALGVMIGDQIGRRCEVWWLRSVWMSRVRV